MAHCWAWRWLRQRPRPATWRYSTWCVGSNRT
jgi:hypothetical protein